MRRFGQGVFSPFIAMKSVLSTCVKQFIFILEYVFYELKYYLIGGEAITHDWMYKSKNKCDPENRSGYIAVVTGGARGIGAALVKKLLLCDMKVIICCRNLESGKQTLSKIREEGVKSGEAVFYQLDLLSLESVISCANQIQTDFSSIDLLVNNAGIMFPPYAETKEGFESQWGVNYVGPFMFTHLLLPLMEKSPTAAKGRVVNVTSCAHTAAASINLNNINMKNYFITSKAYAQSKLAQILFTYHLEKLLRNKQSNVHILSVHPGIVNTDIFDGTALKIFFPWVLKHFCKSADEGATSVLYACISNEIEGKGGLYLSNCTSLSPSRLAQDTTLQSNLFYHTMKVLNINEFGQPLLKT